MPMKIATHSQAWGSSSSGYDNWAEFAVCGKLAACGRVLTNSNSRFGSMTRKALGLSEGVLKDKQSRKPSKLMTRVRFPSPAPKLFNALANTPAVF